MAPENADIELSTILLSWNRVHLLQKTIESYLNTLTVKSELIIVDNASTDGSRKLIESTCNGRPDCHAIFLSQNIGGEALNIGMSKTRGEYLHISENDIEYLPGWDIDLLRKFKVFPELGQLSPFSPFHQADLGEIWVDKAAQPLSREGVTIYVSDENVSSSCIVRREIWNRGVRWKSYESGNFRFPYDGIFSFDVRNLGYKVAWNDRYVAINWGHNIREFLNDPAYYIEDYRAKEWFGLDGFRDRLRAHGYDLFTEDGKQYTIRERRTG